MALKNWTSSPKFFIATLILSIALLIFIGSTTYRQIEELREATDRITHTMAVEKEINSLFSHYVLMQSDAFEQILRSGGLDQTAFARHKKKQDSLYHTLKKVTQNIPQQQQYLVEVERVESELYTSLEKLAQTSTNSTQPETDWAQSLQPITIAMKKLERIQDQMLSVEDTLMQLWKEQYRSSVFFTPLMTLVLGSFSLSVFVFAFWRVNQQRKATQRTQTFLENVLAHTNNVISFFSPVRDSEGIIKDFKIEFTNHAIEPFLKRKSSSIQNHLMSELLPMNFNNGIFDELVVVLEVQKTRKFKTLFEFEGTTTWFYTVASLLNGGVLTTSTDITEQVTSNRELRLKNEELQRSNTELKSFNRVASHDLQEPMRKIQLFVSRILESEIQQLSEKGKTYFEKVSSAAHRMQTLIKYLLAYSRLDKTKDDFQDIALQEVLNKVLEDMEERIEESGIEIAIDELPTIRGIPFQLEQLLNNLISNAIKYRGNTENPKIVIDCKKLSRADIPDEFEKVYEQYYRLSVMDNGIGFDNAQAEKIFGLFERLHQQNEYSGTGIGLAICKKIAENHKGHIIAESGKGKGATFCVYLPV